MSTLKRGHLVELRDGEKFVVSDVDTKNHVCDGYYLKYTNRKCRKRLDSIMCIISIYPKSHFVYNDDGGVDYNEF